MLQGWSISVFDSVFWVTQNKEWDESKSELEEEEEEEEGKKSNGRKRRETYKNK